MRILQIEINEDVLQLALSKGHLAPSDFIVTSTFDYEESAESRAALMEARTIEKNAKSDYRAAMEKADKLRKKATKLRQDPN